MTKGMRIMNLDLVQSLVRQLEGLKRAKIETEVQIGVEVLIEVELANTGHCFHIGVEMLDEIIGQRMMSIADDLIALGITDEASVIIGFENT